jgi:hypothetical protein
MIRRDVAPSVTRMPISRVRRVTMIAITAYTPTSASTSVTVPRPIKAVENHRKKARSSLATSSSRSGRFSTSVGTRSYSARRSGPTYATSHP